MHVHACSGMFISCFFFFLHSELQNIFEIQTLPSFSWKSLYLFIWWGYIFSRWRDSCPTGHVSRRRMRVNANLFATRSHTRCTLYYDLSILRAEHHINQTIGTRIHDIAKSYCCKKKTNMMFSMCNQWKIFPKINANGQAREHIRNTNRMAINTRFAFCPLIESVRPSVDLSLRWTRSFCMRQTVTTEITVSGMNP